MKQLSNTKVTVRLRKNEERKEWYVYIESYPVFVPGKQTPQRIREYLNRTVTTVEWDRKRTARTGADGTKTYKPKRHANSSNSIQVNWQRVYELLKLFAGNYLPFSKIDNRLAEEFRLYLLSAPCGGNKSGTISQNTAATYFSIFKAALKQAFIDDYLTVDLSAKIKGIQEQESRREYLTVEELNTLAATPCEREVLKRAALFSALTGLRHCDIQKLQWKEISMDGGQARLHFTQKKTKGVEYMPISQQALQLCGEPGEPEQLVFEDLPDPSWISRPLKLWIEAAGIKKRISFHIARHRKPFNRMYFSVLQN